MKSNTFNYSLLAVGVATLMGLSTGAMAATPTSGPVIGGAAAIENVATAKYKVGTDTNFQPEVTSNKVIVSISETANFSLVATTDSVVDEKNVDIAATPNTTTKFNHTLANIGNVTDTYTITTTNTDSSIVTKVPNYFLGVANITYTVDVSKLTQAEKDDLVAKNTASGMSISGNTATGTIPNGNKITLLPGLEAALSYQAATGDQKGGYIGVGTLTVTSAFITKADPTKQTLTNENQSIVSLPVFKIEKSAICQGKTDCNSLDLNATDTDIDYSIKVTNVKTDYSVDADNFIIRDVLPKGMTLIEGSIKVQGQNVPPNSNFYTITKTADDRQIVQGSVPNLKVGTNLTITFKVKVDKTVLRAAGTATNHAAVYDHYNDTKPNPDIATGFDIADSTDDTLDTPTNRPNLPDGIEGDGNIGGDTAPIITFTDRDLSISAGKTAEVPVQGEVTYSHTITNKGNENEGGTTRPITITLTDPTTGNSLSIDETEGKKPYYSTDDGVTKLPLEKNTDGTYKLPSTVVLIPNKAADGATSTTGSTVEIGYTVKSDGTSEGEIGTANNNIGLTETSSVILKPAVVAGIDAPTKTVSNTTTIQGLKLEKLVAVVSATGIENLTCPTDTSGLTFGKGTDIKAKPYDCIVYKVTATNTFTTKGLTAVTLSDDQTQWNKQASYQADLKGLIGGSTTGVIDNIPDIKTTFATLPAKGNGTMTFSIKVRP